MDGLSCASGVTAVVSITLQLVQGIHKLIEFWTAVKNAPKRVAELFSHLELLAELLSSGQISCHENVQTNLLERSLWNCKEKVSKLGRKLELASQHINSNNRFASKWEDFKITFKDKEIQELKNTIKDAHGLVLGAQINSLIQITQANQHTSEKVLALVQPQSNPVPIQLSSTQFDVNMRVYEIYETKHIQKGCSTKYKLLDTQNGESIGQHDSIRSLENQSSNSGEITCSACQSKVSRTRRPKINTLNSLKRGYFLYPPKLLSILGVPYGVDVAAISTTGWKYSLEVFRAVPENAPIFEFCRDGNLAAVRTLLKNNHASVWDRDPEGRTPLFVAAGSLNVEIVELLLSEGADSLAIGGKKHHLPIQEVEWSRRDDMDARIAIISALLKHDRDSYEDLYIAHKIYHIVLLYRTGSNWPTMSNNTRWSMVNRLLTRFMHLISSDEVFISYVLEESIGWLFDKEVLHTILRHIPGMIWEGEGVSCIHECIGKRIFERDPISARIILRKTQSLHRPFVKYPSPQGLETPTSYAMFQSTLFFGWRKLLWDMGHKTENIVERELEVDVVRNRGWTRENLTRLFDLDFVPYLAKTSAWTFPDCERCGNVLMNLGYMTPVDLAWRRMLRYLRLGRSIDYYLINDDESESSGVRKLPYRIVCLVCCKDGICVSQGYENDTTDEPFLPLFLEKTTRTEEIKPEEVDCPTQKMPGAFV